MERNASNQIEKVFSGFDLIIFVSRQITCLLLSGLVICLTFWFFDGRDLTLVAWLTLSIFSLGNLVVGWFFRSVRRPLFLSFIILAVGFAILAKTSELFYDTTFDGMRAHQSTIIALKNGWNPFRDKNFGEGVLALEEAKQKYGEFLLEKVSGEDSTLEKARQLRGNFIVGKGYRAGSFHCLCALIFSIFGNVEAAKALNILLAIAAAGITYRFLRTREIQNPVFWALCISLNPVVLYQQMSFMLDGYTYSAFQLFFFSLLSLCYSPQLKIVWMDSLVAGVLLVSTKISGLSYFFALVAAVVICSIVISLLRLEWRGRIMLSLLIVLFCGTFALLYKQIDVTRIVVHNYSVTTIFSDLMKRDHSRPGLSGIPDFNDYSKLEQFFLSHGSPTHINPHRFKLKIPGSVAQGELEQIGEGYGEYRTGGFGPLYSLLLIIAVIYAVLGFKRLCCLSVAVFVIFVLIVSVFSPIWWARWAAYQWMIPFFPLMLNDNTGKTSKIFDVSGIFRSRVLVRMAVMTNVVLVLFPYFLGRWKVSRLIDTELGTIKESDSIVELHSYWFPSNQLWFYRREIPVIFIQPEKESFKEDVAVRLHNIPGTDSAYRMLNREDFSKIGFFQ